MNILFALPCHFCFLVISFKLVLFFMCSRLSTAIDAWYMRRSAEAKLKMYLQLHLSPYEAIRKYNPGIHPMRRAQPEIKQIQR
ncbi:hypothetical protein ACRALDRAFT_210527 [Sodiomyces alcalophilus JCM 7366]|uniref:uncharacterized protein n=1 Tax=Sodiomyces alcalophilus JCM 7366 TaxID=591952 RepID=UPI0039B40778